MTVVASSPAKHWGKPCSSGRTHCWPRHDLLPCRGYFLTYYVKSLPEVYFLRILIFLVVGRTLWRTRVHIAEVHKAEYDSTRMQYGRVIVNYQYRCAVCRAV